VDAQINGAKSGRSFLRPSYFQSGTTQLAAEKHEALFASSPRNPTFSTISSLISAQVGEHTLKKRVGRWSFSRAFLWVRLMAGPCSSGPQSPRNYRAAANARTLSRKPLFQHYMHSFRPEFPYKTLFTPRFKA